MAHASKVSISLGHNLKHQCSLQQYGSLLSPNLLGILYLSYCLWQYYPHNCDVLKCIKGRQTNNIIPLYHFGALSMWNSVPKADWHMNDCPFVCLLCVMPIFTSVCSHTTKTVKRIICKLHKMSLFHPIIHFMKACLAIKLHMKIEWWTNICILHYWYKALIICTRNQISFL